MVVERRGMLKQAAATFCVSAKTAAKWVRRYRSGGLSDLADRSSRPRRSSRQTSSSLLERVLLLRRERWNGWRIARELTGLSFSWTAEIQKHPKSIPLGAFVTFVTYSSNSVWVLYL
jgi:transposase